MGSYKVFLKPSAERELRQTPSQDRERIVRKIADLFSEPRPLGCEKRSGMERYRLRQGSYRIAYEIDDNNKTIRIFKIGHRREIYR